MRRTAMSKTPFSVEQSPLPGSKSEHYSVILEEITAKEVPSKYIDFMMVYYKNGVKVILSQDDLAHPIPLVKNASSKDMAAAFKHVKEVVIAVNTIKLEKDVNHMVDSVLKYHIEP